ncbi:hypothetical protein GCM10011497_06660 [Elstera cyanobacteriorum]|uniref:Uncharacterized protein n=1 Tax=Elstera cyanobacteriorum TaxID=2022747 RepID=A0A255XTI2_9PROT|nr:terminase small subunit [Elstera cyanobacteriorum]OYQ20222.1 hypothetical protein CHR90_05805 [Elstera cyanobacteriorum]GFZ80815.1 hypothetical protein GCM10011497_06660 [Elstera cyanobacteriorum]
MGERIVNRSEMARILEVSEPTLDRMMDRGLPVLQRGGNGKPYQFDVEAVIAWARDDAEREEAARSAREADINQLAMDLNGGATAEIEGVSPGLSGKARIDAINALLLQDKLAKQRGELVPVEDVRADYQAMFARLRQRLLSLDTLLTRSAGLTPAQAAIVRQDMRALLVELAMQIADPDLRPVEPEEMH